MLKRQDSVAASKSRGETDHVVMKSSGCMSGIIQLISKYQKKSKRLTSGTRKQGKVAVVVEHKKDDEVKVAAAGRSPKMQAEPVALVARLMGLQEISCSSSNTEIKRRKLLEALDKCNDDLESIRNILNSLKKVTQIGDAMRPQNPSPKLCNQFPKPKHNYGHITQQRIKRLGAYEPIDKFTNHAPIFHLKPKSCSKGMIQSVEEVCNECEWGQKREAGRIGLILQDHIYRDLIEELLKEMDLLISFPSLSFLACRKRLFF